MRDLEIYTREKTHLVFFLRTIRKYALQTRALEREHSKVEIRYGYYVRIAAFVFWIRGVRTLYSIFKNARRRNSALLPRASSVRFRISRRPRLSPFIGGEVTKEPRVVEPGRSAGGEAVSRLLSPAAETSASRGQMCASFGVFGFFHSPLLHSRLAWRVSGNSRDASRDSGRPWARTSKKAIRASLEALPGRRPRSSRSSRRRSLPCPPGTSQRSSSSRLRDAGF